MNDPRVTVVIPCFNLGRYLDEAVDSVLEQSFPDIGIVIVDDGSTDPETVALLDGYRRERTRVVRTANGGLPAAKNCGIAASSSEFVCALDADDRLAPTMIERSLAALDEDPDLAFVSHWLRTFGDEETDWTPERCDFPALLDVNTVNGAAVVRRAAFDAVGGYDEAFSDGCEDWDFWVTLVECGYRGHILPEVLFHYRRRPDSMSRSMQQGDAHPRLFRRLVEKHRAAYTEHITALVARRERDAATTRLHTRELDHEYATWFANELPARRDDIRRLDRLRHGPITPERVAGLEAELERTRGEVAALRSSMSWRITRPLRKALDLVRGAKGAP
jgi:glycosyltransferase involved in cell wall biosynthesis